MNPEDKPEESIAGGTCVIATSDMLALAIEHWRLSSWAFITVGNAGAVRHAARRIGDVLLRWQIEARSLDGLPFDAGMAARVIDVVEDATKPKGFEIVDETLSPLVIFRGTVVKPAEVVVRRGTGPAR